MKFTLLPLKLVEMFQDGRSLGTFRFVSAWEGFEKWEQIETGGTVIVRCTQRGWIEQLFDGVFDVKGAARAPTEIDVIGITPSLIRPADAKSA